MPRLNQHEVAPTDRAPRHHHGAARHVGGASRKVEPPRRATPRPSAPRRGSPTSWKRSRQAPSPPVSPSVPTCWHLSITILAACSRARDQERCGSARTVAASRSTSTCRRRRPAMMFSHSPSAATSAACLRLHDQARAMGRRAAHAGECRPARGQRRQRVAGLSGHARAGARATRRFIPRVAARTPISGDPVMGLISRILGIRSGPGSSARPATRQSARRATQQLVGSDARR